MQSRSAVYAVAVAIVVALALQTGNEATASSDPGASEVGGPLEAPATAVALAAGYNHNCVVTTTGGLMCWGDNAFGQVGDGTLGNALVPVDVSGLTSGVTSAAPGEDHTCALVTGGVECWGGNWQGRLGADPLAVPVSLTPIVVFTPPPTVDAIAVGAGHSCAVLSGGAKCWGSNEYGQLGNGVSGAGANPTPVDVLAVVTPSPTPLTGVSSVVAGRYHTCALTATGGVKCWGRNDRGQLGNGTGGDGSDAYNSSTPVDVLADAIPSPVALSGVTSITAGEYHTCALTTGQGVKCWGGNAFGQLGNNQSWNRNIAVDVSSLSSSVLGVSAGANHTCAVTTGGGAKCWGDD
jgi:alpha-tubulin suppressor-like RCC1 family protein